MADELQELLLQFLTIHSLKQETATCNVLIQLLLLESTFWQFCQPALETSSSTMCFINFKKDLLLPVNWLIEDCA